jgi:hypothetical protein
VVRFLRIFDPQPEGVRPVGGGAGLLVRILQRPAFGGVAVEHSGLAECTAEHKDVRSDLAGFQGLLVAGPVLACQGLVQLLGELLGFA